jgi:hypothetical protein
MLENDLMKLQLQNPNARDKVKKISAECKNLYDKYWRLYSSNWTEYEKMKVISCLAKSAYYCGISFMVFG